MIARSSSMVSERSNFDGRASFRSVSRRDKRITKMRVASAIMKAKVPMMAISAEIDGGGNRDGDGDDHGRALGMEDDDTAQGRVTIRTHDRYRDDGVVNEPWTSLSLSSPTSASLRRQTRH